MMIPKDLTPDGFVMNRADRRKAKRDAGKEKKEPPFWAASRTPTNQMWARRIGPVNF